MAAGKNNEIPRGGDKMENFQPHEHAEAGEKLLQGSGAYAPKEINMKGESGVEGKLAQFQETQPKAFGDRINALPEEHKKTMLEHITMLKDSAKDDPTIAAQVKEFWEKVAARVQV